MKRKASIIIILFVGSFVWSHIECENKKEVKENLSITYSQEITSLKIENEKLKSKIDDLLVLHNEQVHFYERNINTITWIVGAFFLLFNAGFALFIWFFKKPKDLLRDIENKRKDAVLIMEKLEKDGKILLDNIEMQHKYQESLFLLGKKGLYFYTAEDWNTIQIYADKACEKKDQDRNANDNLFIGLWYYKQKDYKHAIKAFKIATNLDRKSEIAFKNLGNAYEEEKDYTNAIKSYRKVIDLNPNSIGAYNNLGISYGRIGQVEKAIECFQKAIKLDPDDGYIYTNLLESYLLNNDDFEKSIVCAFETKFKNDTNVYPIYEMLCIYKQITQGKDPSELLHKWNNKYCTIGSGEDFCGIEIWIENQTDQKIKDNLNEALKFFRQFEEL